MILKITIKERIDNIYSSELSINLVNKNVSYLKGDTIIKNTEFAISEEEITNILKDYTTYWEKERISSASLNSRLIEINIYTDTDIVNYHFENSFPEDLEEFMKALKNKLGIVD